MHHECGNSSNIIQHQMIIHLKKLDTSISTQTVGNNHIKGPSKRSKSSETVDLDLQSYC